MEQIKKYRTLDDYGKESITLMLDREVKRVEEIQRQKEIESLTMELSEDGLDALIKGIQKQSPFIITPKA